MILKIILCTLAFISIGEANASRILLTPIKPEKWLRVLPIGKISATIWDRDTGELVAKATRDFGDCEGCVRGFSLNQGFEFRFEGLKLSSLKAEKKSARGVKIKDCSEGSDQYSQTISCDLITKSIPYKATFRIE